MASYKLIGRYMEGIKIIGYQVQSDSGEISKIKKETMEKLAEQGAISNCRIIRDNGKVYVRGVGVRICELPAVNVTGNSDAANGTNSTIEIISRILDKDEVVGYLVEDSTGRKYRISKEKAWTLSMEGKISNTTAKVSGSNKLISGNGIKLKNLPSMQVDEQ